MSKASSVITIILIFLLFFSCTLPDDTVNSSALESPILRGVVKSFPVLPAVSSIRAVSSSNTITREDMVGVPALLSLFLLSDINFEKPVATVKTKADGSYTVTADDVKPYLVDEGLVEVDSTDEEVSVAFRSLGQLQVRALIVKQDSEGANSAMAIQSIADPNDLDMDTGEPNILTVDPIVHRVVKIIVDQIRESISSLNTLGISSSIIDSLIEQVISTVVPEIECVLESAETSIIEVPEGQTIDEIIYQQERELKLEVSNDDILELESVLQADSEVNSIEDSLDSLFAAENVLEDISTASSLDIEHQGLLDSLEAALNSSIEDTIQEEEVELDSEGIAKLEEFRLNYKRNLVLSLGYMVAFDSDGDGSYESIIVPFIPAPWMDKDILPGTIYNDNNNLRLITIPGLETKLSVLKTKFDTVDKFNETFSMGVNNQDTLEILTYIKFGETLSNSTLLSDNFINALPRFEDATASLRVEQFCNTIAANSRLTPLPYYVGVEGHFAVDPYISMIDDVEADPGQMLDFILYNFANSGDSNMTNFLDQVKIQEALAPKVLYEEYLALFIEHGNDGYDYGQLFPTTDDYSTILKDSNIYQDWYLGLYSKFDGTDDSTATASVFSKDVTKDTQLAAYDILSLYRLLTDFLYLYSNNDDSPPAVAEYDLSIDESGDVHFTPECTNIYKLVTSSGKTSSELLMTLNDLTNDTDLSYSVLLEAKGNLYEADGLYSDFYTIPTFAELTYPDLDITTPAEGAELSQTVTISVDLILTYNYIHGITLFVDDEVVQINNYNGQESESFTLDTSQYANGSHTISCMVSDSYNNSTTKSIGVTINN